jgi:hypothetical protein
MLTDFGLAIDNLKERLKKSKSTFMKGTIGY